MLFERFESEGLSHYSYLVGDGGEAAVIDPRRDCEIYLDRARAADHRIRYVLETHRNEDYLIGSRELSRLTGAETYHADAHLSYEYGQPARDQQSWSLGGLELRAIHTPGHTEGSMSYLLEDSGGAPWMVFCGDLCFAGDVGRVDLLGEDRMEEMAQSLYESLFERILPLGDEVILCPAHGSGSVCGSSIADRVWTTIGMERRYNPKLQNQDRDAFVAATAHAQPRPPYFRRMEELNLRPPLLAERSWMMPLGPDELAEEAEDGLVLDVRSVEAFGGSHIPGSLSIWADGVAAYGGYFLPYDKKILLVYGSEDPAEMERRLLRMGYDNVSGYLAGGLIGWHKAARDTRRFEMISPPEACRRLDSEEGLRLLDVREEGERDSEGRLGSAAEIPLPQLADRIHAIEKGGPICVFCGSGLRSTIAASLLEREGHERLMVTLGGTKGWSSTTCPLRSSGS
jgi:hydroxyacylglutathione hydrolase